jgi:serine-type D-Ala-D-Ala carboxypeptidase/endopeptidase (penicillin-binding protein 4)
MVYGLRFMFLRFISIFFLLIACVTQAQTTPPVQEWLRSASIPLTDVGLLVAPADGAGRALISLNTQQALNPASVMKLYTTYGALELLGAPFTWKTQALSSGKLQNGTLTGDIYVKGSGDPSLKTEDVWRLLRELKLAGVKHIAGDWVLDRNIFAEDNSDTNKFDGKGTSPYNVKPDGLLMSFNSTRLAFKPADAGWKIVADPLPIGWSIQNTVESSKAACPSGSSAWQDGLVLSFIKTQTGGVISLSGIIPKLCGFKETYKAFVPAQLYASSLIKSLWSELGGTHSGDFKSGTTPTDAIVLAEIDSAPLSTIIRDINKRSNNVMARMLYLNLARVPQANKAAAEQRLRAWLSSAGLNDSVLVFENGSGLSREERSSAAALTKLLQYAYAGPLMPEFMSSLAVVAQDGTVAKRMGSAAGSAHLKTGTLSDSAALAGYVLGASGKRYTFVAIVNNSNVSGARTVMDKLVQWVQQNG